MFMMVMRTRAASAEARTVFMWPPLPNDPRPRLQVRLGAGIAGDC